MGWSGRAPALPARQAGKGPCLIGMEACTGAHHLSRKLQALGHDARLMPTNYVRPYSKGDKNDYRDVGDLRPWGAADFAKRLVNFPERLTTLFGPNKKAAAQDKHQPIGNEGQERHRD
jgi:transposase